MFKPLMPKFRPDPSARLKDIAEKQVPAKLKLIVVQRVLWILYSRCPLHIIKVPFPTPRCPQPGFGTQLKIEKNVP